MFYSVFGDILGEFLDILDDMWPVITSSTQIIMQKSVFGWYSFIRNVTNCTYTSVVWADVS